MLSVAESRVLGMDFKISEILILQIDYHDVVPTYLFVMIIFIIKFKRNVEKLLSLKIMRVIHLCVKNLKKKRVFINNFVFLIIELFQQNFSVKFFCLL